MLSRVWSDLRYRLRALMRSRTVTREIDAELQFHLEQEASKHRQAGLDPIEAQRKAALGLGGLGHVREEVRDAHGTVLVTRLIQDARFALRMLGKSPTFTVVAVLAIALGSGAVTTIVSAANALLLRPIPGIEAPDRVVDLNRTAGPQGREPRTSSYPLYVALRDQSRLLSGIAAWSAAQLTITAGAQGTTAFANLASDNYFAVLGVRPLLGRFFATGDDRARGAHAEIVLSEGFWRQRFGGDSALIGKAVSVNGSPYVVIGVAPAAFRGVAPLVRTDAWVPLGMTDQLRPATALLSNPRGSWLMLVGRLAPHATIAAASAEAATILARLKATSSDVDPDAGMAISAATGVPGDAHGTLVSFIALLLVVATLVLLIASVNVAGMLLARATARRHEMAIRVALGAGRQRIIAQLLTESVVLFLGGAAGGYLIAIWSTRIASRVPLRLEVPVTVDLSPDYRVLAIALGVALITGVAFGLAPAFEATRVDPSAGLRTGTAGAGTRRSSLRQVLVTAQLAVSLVLLMSGGLFLRALYRGLQVPTGFTTTGVSTAALDVSSAGYSDDRAREFYDQLKTRLLATGNVAAVSFIQPLPLSNSVYSEDFAVEGYQARTGEHPDGKVDLDLATIGADYFKVTGIPIVEGREFGVDDKATSPKVAVINQTFAQTYWPGVDPIGRTVTGDEGMMTVVGVARDAKYASLNEAPLPFIYLPLTQHWGSATHLLVRTSGQVAALGTAIRDAVHGIDPIFPQPVSTTLDAATSVALLPQRIAAIVTGAMGALGFLLALIGLYGTLAYRVSQRAREIGLRMALGADRVAVMRMVLREGMRLVAIGGAIGMALAVATTRVMSRFLFGVSPLDPLVFAAIPAALVCAAFLAIIVPARKAAATNPLDTLRNN
ncbi:MAG TPA: ABC transporter permease [Gemmatimonadales bacterium]|jgi:predicted permease